MATEETRSGGKLFVAHFSGCYLGGIAVTRAATVSAALHYFNSHPTVTMNQKVTEEDVREIDLDTQTVAVLWDGDY